MTSDFTPTVERFSGFAGIYDRYRPAPPEALADVLSLLANVERPDLVVDLGCGTGLSTRYWAGRARRVIGVDPSHDMLHQAEVATVVPEVTYRLGFGHATGLPDDCADVVTCSQSFHWMEPESTLAEVARLLRSGGVFAACDHDFPLVPRWEADLAFHAFNKYVQALEDRAQLSASVSRWDKGKHLARIEASGQFRYTREILLHHVEPGDAERLVGFALSHGSVETVLKAGFSEADLGLDRLRADVERLLGDEPRPWYWCMRVRVGVK
jgi:ubiquinone/menaquinone biosynthesis C-methylase UbiE